MHPDSIAAIVRAYAGIRLSPTQMESLEALAISALGRGTVSGGGVAARLANPAELQAFVERLTIPETYFNRHEEQLDALFEARMPRLLDRARAGGRRLRVWSAGCSTGDEPYTLAIRFAELGLLHEVEIVATDLNRSSLEYARNAVYSERALSHLPEPLVERYFARRAGRYQLVRALREHVEFTQLNLAAGEYPSPANRTATVDMILCRNVLMYFAPETMAAVIERFHRALVPGGVLALGPVETAVDPARFEAVGFPGAFLFDRVDARRAAIEPTAPAHAPPAVTDLERPVTATRSAAHETRPSRSTSVGASTPEPDEASLFARAETLADRGERDAAIEVLGGIIDRHPESARAHYLMGVVLLDEPGKAEAHFRRALYLDGGHWLARWHRARCMERLGDADAAQQAFRLLEQAASAEPPERMIDEREGITCGLLALMCRQVLR